jgi:hypothetical protein
LVLVRSGPVRGGSTLKLHGAYIQVFALTPTIGRDDLKISSSDRYLGEGSKFASSTLTKSYQGENVFKDWARIVDCGDVPMTFLDNEIALKQLENAHKVRYLILFCSDFALCTSNGFAHIV